MRKEAPSHICEELRRIDPLLRLRWSYEKKRFLLERKCDKAFLPKPVRYSKDASGKVRESLAAEFSDRYIAYHDGYIPIMEANTLDRRLFWTLYTHDSQRAGRYFFLKQKEKEEMQERYEERKRRERIRDISGEAYDHLQYLQGERTFFKGH